MAKSSLSAVSPRATGAVGVPRLVLSAETKSRSPSLANLWQVPLLLASLALFTLAAYLFLDPQPAQSYHRQLAIARRDMDAQRYDAAIGRLNDLLVSSPESRDAGATRLLIAEAVDRQIQRNRRQESPQAHRRIISEIHAAYEAGIAPTPGTSDRLARSHGFLGDIDEAAAQFRRAVELMERDEKPEQGVPMRRGEIELLISCKRLVSAQLALEQFLTVPGLSDDERAWALGELARMHIDAGRSAEARSLLAAATALSPDDSIQGQVAYWQGYAAWNVGDQVVAQQQLQAACRQLGAGHPLEAEACYLLGRIAQDHAKLDEAGAFFDRVLADHPDSPVAPRAQLAAGMVKVLAGDDSRGVAQLAATAEEIALRPALEPLAEDVVAVLQRAARILTSRGSHELALQVLDSEGTLLAHPSGDFLARRAGTLEQLAQIAAGGAAGEEGIDANLSERRLRVLRREAGEALVAAARQLRNEGSPRYEALLWAGASYLGQAGEHAELVSSLQQFAADQPEDPITPAVLARLGIAHLDSGDEARAIETFEMIHKRHPQSEAAIDISVPFARALISQGSERFGDARDVLSGVIGSAQAAPEVRRSALWELGLLAYQSGHYEDALANLEELSRQGDPAGVERAQLAFLVGDCLRRSALQKLAEASQPQDPLKPAETGAQLAAGSTDAPGPNLDPALRSALVAAEAKFNDTIELYRQVSAEETLDDDYERMAYFYRADCAFELGRLEDAVALYDSAARRYGDDPASLAAYVKMADALARLQRPREAELAHERARWLLKRLGPEVLRDGRLPLSKDYWERWLISAGGVDAG
jgi:tetratricopeptide (TPR) repeat protein